MTRADLKPFIEENVDMGKGLSERIIRDYIEIDKPYENHTWSRLQATRLQSSLAKRGIAVSLEDLMYGKVDTREVFEEWAIEAAATGYSVSNLAFGS